jgi:hypothetical protein
MASGSKSVGNECQRGKKGIGQRGRTSRRGIVQKSELLVERERFLGCHCGCAGGRGGRMRGNVKKC